MFVWTEQAEKDFCTKYPNRKNERRAGTVAMWDGRPLNAGTILEGYQERGWVCEVVNKKRKPKKKKSNNRRQALTSKEKRQRWGKLMYYFAQPSHPSVAEVARLMGFKSYIAINKFVDRHGEEMAAKYGKLPFVPGVKRDYWFKVMEAAQ